MYHTHNFVLHPLPTFYRFIRWPRERLWSLIPSHLQESAQQIELHLAIIEQDSGIASTVGASASQTADHLVLWLSLSECVKLQANYAYLDCCVASRTAKTSKNSTHFAFWRWQVGKATSHPTPPKLIIAICLWARWSWPRWRHTFNDGVRMPSGHFCVSRQRKWVSRLVSMTQ